MHKYSVLMSVYYKDSPEYLMQSIESMLNQTIVCEQFVIVQDGKLGNQLEEVIDKYANVYTNMFCIVKLEENRGLGKALDIGLNYCRNNLVARMDADDISLPNRCEKLLGLFEKDSRLAIAGTDIDEFYDNPGHIISSRIVPHDYKSICNFMRRRSSFNHPTVMFKKDEVIRCGGYGNMRRKQDLDLFARMINKGCYAQNINESLLLFRSNADNYKRRKSWDYCKSYIQVQKLNYKRGYCSLFDFVYVLCGQLILYTLPVSIMKIISDNYLRKTRN